jgi:dipeptidyl aminopeptidase/acylaminoacyl peptidase
MTRALQHLPVMLLVALISALPAGRAMAASAVPLLDRELFFGPPRVSAAQLSPDGAWICFISTYKGVRNIWLTSSSAPFASVRPVTDSRHPIPACLWSHDGAFLLYEQDRGGNEQYHIWRVAMAEIIADKVAMPAAVDLTPLQGVRAVLYAMPKNAPGSLVIGLNHRDSAIHDPYMVDIATGERRLLRENNENVGAWITDSHGRLRLAMRSTPAGGTELLRVDTQGYSRIAAVGADEELIPLKCREQSGSCYVVSNAGEDVDLLRLMLLDMQSGEMQLIEQDPEGQVDFGNAHFHPLSEELLFTHYLGDRLRVYPRTAAAAQLWQRLRTALPHGEVTIDSAADDLSLLLVRHSSDLDPGTLYLYEPENQKMTLLYRVRPELPRESLARMWPLSFRARDGMIIHAYLTLPPGALPRDLPVVMYVHGGPWKRNYWRSDPYAQFLANRGYAVMQVNYRGSAGYGKRYLNAGVGEHGTGFMQHDISDAVAYLKENHIAAAGRIAIFGASFGGYAALAGVAFTPDLYACAIAYAAPSNLVSFSESFPAYWQPFLRNSWHKWIGDPSVPADRVEMLARSPLFKSRQIRAPLLVIHGANDPRVPQREADQLVAALRDNGKAVEYLVAPDEGHGFNAAGNRTAMAAAVEEFLAGCLGGRYQREMSAATRKRLAEIRVDVARLQSAADSGTE